MSEKVVLPREVAEDIDRLRKKGCSNFAILRLAYEPDSDYSAIRKWAFDISGRGTPDLLMKALVNGYEVEQTPEEKLRDYYKDAMKMWQTSDNAYVKREGMAKISAIKTTLNILGVTIGGINGKEDDK